MNMNKYLFYLFTGLDQDEYDGEYSGKLNIDVVYRISVYF